MCEDAFESRKPTCATYRCPNGCVHLVWNNVTLHLLPSEWDLLAETVAASESNSLFQEFKTGDFQLERWNTRDTHEKRLDTIKNFLFF